MATITSAEFSWPLTSTATVDACNFINPVEEENCSQSDRNSSYSFHAWQLQRPIRDGQRSAKLSTRVDQVRLPVIGISQHRQSSKTDISFDANYFGCHGDSKWKQGAASLYIALLHILRMLPLLLYALPRRPFQLHRRILKAIYGHRTQLLKIADYEGVGWG